MRGPDRESWIDVEPPGPMALGPPMGVSLGLLCRRGLEILRPWLVQPDSLPVPACQSEVVSNLVGQCESYCTETTRWFVRLDASERPIVASHVSPGRQTFYPSPALLPSHHFGHEARCRHSCPLHTAAIPQCLHGVRVRPGLTTLGTWYYVLSIMRQLLTSAISALVSMIIGAVVHWQTSILRMHLPSYSRKSRPKRVPKSQDRPEFGSDQDLVRDSPAEAADRGEG